LLCGRVLTRRVDFADSTIDDNLSIFRTFPRFHSVCVVSCSCDALASYLESPKRLSSELNTFGCSNVSSSAEVALRAVS